MKQQTFGATVAALRKERGMTQLDLAERMGVTDKAVSKWERDLSFPDAASLPKLAETLGVTVDQLMLGKMDATAPAPAETARLIPTILNGVALAMGVAVTALSALHQLGAEDALPMLGLGLACLAAAQLAGR
ncbi:MAG TPA: helix-turn-helix domain-containing protein [Candidatus Faecalibacterium faecipullorum]|uniref:Helix-turn-helix domain-containing protein n=1 Tax=Candidatus Faecalibacterium faecipullorum TaxID=2838578 RepID=A0A9D2S6R9_9FIRM|nr:helix-turn-helix domain-containing protein [Candidatus Faecalibacterium faecipullorum]